MSEITQEKHKWVMLVINPDPLRKWRGGGGSGGGGRREWDCNFVVQPIVSRLNDYLSKSHV